MFLAIITEYKKSILLIILYGIGICIGGSILERTNISWIQHNLTFIVYSILFPLAIVLFRKEFILWIKQFKSKDIDQFVIIGFFTFIGMVAASILVSRYGVENANEDTLTSMVNHNKFLLNVSILLFAPVVEELVYRYCVYSFWGNNHIVGCIVTALLFAFSHLWGFILVYGQWSQILAMLPYFVLGLGLSFLYYRTNNLMFPILLHMIINFIGLC